MKSAFFTVDEFIVGFDRTTPPIKLVRDASLVHRTGVIQHTFRPDSVDMYFDEALWRRLLEFVQTFGVVTVIDRPWGTKGPNRDWHSGAATQPSRADEVALADFLADWSGEMPPEFILARYNDRLLLCSATEYWTQVGGPWPYADSYTYSICTEDDQSTRIVSFLRASPDAEHWTMSSEFLRAHV